MSDLTDEKFYEICDILRFKYEWNNPDCLKGIKDIIMATEDYNKKQKQANGVSTSHDKALNIADVNGWRSVSKVSQLKRGDIVKNRLSGNTYVVDSNYGERASAVTVQDITNPSEWIVLACR